MPVSGMCCRPGCSDPRHRQTHWENRLIIGGREELQTCITPRRGPLHIHHDLCGFEAVLSVCWMLTLDSGTQPGLSQAELCLVLLRPTKVQLGALWQKHSKDSIMSAGKCFYDPLIVPHTEITGAAAGSVSVTESVSHHFITGDTFVTYNLTFCC